MISRRTMLFTVAAAASPLSLQEVIARAASPDATQLPPSVRAPLFGMATEAQLAAGQIPTRDALKALTLTFGPAGANVAGQAPPANSPLGVPESSIFALAEAPTSKLFSIEPHDVAHAAGIVGQIIAVGLAPYVSTGAAIALQVGGILTEPTLNYVADHPSLDNSIVPLLPPTSDSTINATSGTLAALIASQYQSDRNFAGNVSAGPLKASLGLDFSLLSSDTSLLDAAVKDTTNGDAASILKALGDAKTLQLHEADTIQKLQDSIDGAVKNFGAKAPARAAQDAIAQTEKDRAARLESLRQQSQELTGISDIASFFVGTVFGNPSAAKKLSTACDAVIKMYVAVNQYNLKAIGGFALAGTALGSVNLLVGVFSSASDPVLQALDVVNKKLDTILRQIQVIEAQQVELLEEVREILRLVQTNFSAVNARLSRIESQINALRSQVNVNDRTTRLDGFYRTVDYCRSALATNVRDRDKFRDYLTDLYEFAIRSSKAPSLAGDPISSPTITDYAQSLRVQGSVDLAFALLPDGAAQFPNPTFVLIRAAGLWVRMHILKPGYLLVRYRLRMMRYICRRFGMRACGCGRSFKLAQEKPLEQSS
jgi:hypothetical protein